MLIDTHTHLWFPEYQSDLENVLARAKAANVRKMIVPGTSVESSKKAIALAKKYPGVIYAAVGVHPEELLNKHTSVNDQIKKLASENSQQIVAIGEIGTDKNDEEMQKCINEQMALFRKQCEVALELDLPIIVHTRNSFPETWEVLQSLPKMPQGQFHCFSIDEEALKTVLAQGFYVSFCGNITWSKRVAKLVPIVPSDRLLLETDSPLMVPRNQKGEPIAGSERNESVNVTILAQTISDLRGVSLQEVADQTTENAVRLFKL